MNYDKWFKSNPNPNPSRIEWVKEVLLNRDIDVNKPQIISIKKDNYETRTNAFHLAISKGNLEVVEVLCNYKIQYLNLDFESEVTYWGGLSVKTSIFRKKYTWKQWLHEIKDEQIKRKMENMIKTALKQPSSEHTGSYGDKFENDTKDCSQNNTTATNLRLQNNVALSLLLESIIHDAFVEDNYVIFDILIGQWKKYSSKYSLGSMNMYNFNGQHNFL